MIGLYSRWIPNFGSTSSTLTPLWQDNWFQTWKWFESFLQLLRSSLFDWAGLQTPPEERGGRLQQWGRVGDLVRHLYTFQRELVSSLQTTQYTESDLSHPELSCSPPSPSDYWNFCPFSSVPPVLLDVSIFTVYQYIVIRLVLNTPTTPDLLTWECEGDWERDTKRLT